MAFTGKATYDGGTTLPEISEDLAPDVAILAQTITPLLDRIGDGARPAMSPQTQWLEDALNPNSDTMDGAFTTGAATISVDNATYFRKGDVIRPQDSDERMLVTSVAAPNITVTRGYGGSTKEALTDAQVLEIVGNANLEGDSAPAVRDQNRSRVSNYTQLFLETVLVSDSDEAARKGGDVGSELQYQILRRLEESMIYLERAAVNGIQHATTPVGSSTIRRTMQGISRFIEAKTGAVNIDKSSAALTEDGLNDALRQVWDKGGRPDIILTGSVQKRKISSFITPFAQYDLTQRRSDLTISRTVGMYESDFGLQRVILSPSVNRDTILILDSSRLEIVPLVGMSFHSKVVATTGSHEKRLLQGEYTLRCRNADAHGRVHNLATS